MSPSVTATWRMLSPNRQTRSRRASATPAAARAQSPSRSRDLRVLPVAHDRRPGDAQPGEHVPELAVAVRRLVEVHEVHVDRRPREVAVRLGVEVDERLAQRAQPGDPHLGGREGVHPGDDARGSSGSASASASSAAMPSGEVTTGLAMIRTGTARRAVEPFGDLPRRASATWRQRIRRRTGPGCPSRTTRPAPERLHADLPSLVRRHPPPGPGPGAPAGAASAESWRAMLSCSSR